LRFDLQVETEQIQYLVLNAMGRLHELHFFQKFSSIERTISQFIFKRKVQVSLMNGINFQGKLRYLGIYAGCNVAPEIMVCLFMGLQFKDFLLWWELDVTHGNHKALARNGCQAII